MEEDGVIQEKGKEKRWTGRMVRGGGEGDLKRKKRQYRKCESHGGIYKEKEKRRRREEE